MSNPSGASAVLLEVDDRKVASVILNRPAVNNAYDGHFIASLLGAVDSLDKVAGLRAVVVKANGRHFQAGADLKWLEHVLWSDPEERGKINRALSELATGLEDESRKLLVQAQEIEAYARRDWPDRATGTKVTRAS